MVLSLTACTKGGEQPAFNYHVDRFADLQVLRYKVSGFSELPVKQKLLIYYLSQATLEGRDILFDQNFYLNLPIRRTLEAVYENYEGNRDADNFKQLEVYLKRVWFSNGIHHHYGEEKFLPGFSEAFFSEVVRSLNPALLPLKEGEGVDNLLAAIVPAMFDPRLYAKKVNQASGEDLVITSANNYYGKGIIQKEVEAFYGSMKRPGDDKPVSYGLNSRLVKEDGQLTEKVWHIGGLYSSAIERIVSWLEKAQGVAENEQQEQVISALISYYRSGCLAQFDEYSILWLKDTASHIDFINGFIETYGDPLGIKASWEGLVNFKNIEATKRTETISTNALWFEQNSPTDKRFRKDSVTGVSAKVITVAMLGGDCFPPTPIGINLPNSNWIRHDYGSKSVTIENITEAYDKASQGSGFAEEFVWSDAERALLTEYGFMTNNLDVDLHECLGHGSGKLLPGVSADALKEYGATIEETRADLFGLYFIADNKMIDLGLLPNAEAYKAEYYRFMMNGLMTQLARIEPGKNIEESHMRNRQLIARWVYEKGRADNVVEIREKEGKHYVLVNNYDKLRLLFGELLAEIQRVKSEGDYTGAKSLVENYAVKVDSTLHNEVLQRYAALNLAPYKGFVNPVMTPVTDAAGNVTDIRVDYTEGYTEQMLRYSKQYSVLSSYN